MILFLDFDGVLHPFPKPNDPAQLFVNLDRLEGVFREYPDMQIVVSSTWRESHTLLELKALFSSDLRGRVIDVLPRIQVRGLADMENIRDTLNNS